MKLLLILVGFFACMSVERVGFRKWSFVFRPGILFLVVMVALVCAGCGNEEVANKTSSPVVKMERDYRMDAVSTRTDIWTGCEYLVVRGANGSFGGITPRMGANGKQICRKVTP